MVRSQNLFREFIHWRSRMVVYVAIALTVFALVGLIVLVSASPINVARFGLALQLFGTLAFIPDVIGRENFQWGKGKTAAGGEPSVYTTGANQPVSSPVVQPFTVVPVMEGEDFFLYYQRYNLPILLGNMIASLGFIWLLVALLLGIQGVQFPEEQLLRAMLCVLGFAWINFFLLIEIFRLNQSLIPPSLLACFFPIDILVGVLGIVFAGILHILLRWLPKGGLFLLQNGARQTLLTVTLPCFTIGLAFELLATFL